MTRSASHPAAAVRAEPGLIVERNIADQDGFYADLLAAHRGLDDSESVALNARLVLILANHVGDPAALRQALDLARRAGPGLSTTAE